MTRVEKYWFGKVSHIIVVMTRSPRVEVDDVGKSMPELGHLSEKYSGSPHGEPPSCTASRGSTCQAPES
jgi:hypothetical protein